MQNAQVQVLTGANGDENEIAMAACALRVMRPDLAINKLANAFKRETARALHVIEFGRHCACGNSVDVSEQEYRRLMFFMEDFVNEYLALDIYGRINIPETRSKHCGPSCGEVINKRGNIDE